MLIHKLQQKLLERAEQNNLRKLSVRNGMADFCSNDYLGLARSKALAQKIAQEVSSLDAYSNGSTGSRLLSGNSILAEQLENELSVLFRAEKVILMNSGYNANLSVLASIPQKGDTILYDELIHASCKDGYRLSFASRFPFKHNDLSDLELKLKRGKGNLFVVVESVYSMDGDFAPLKSIVALCDHYGAYIILDEAHSTGVFGVDGSGLAVELGIENKIFARIYTFGKGMGVHGACVAGSKLLIDYLINFARPLIYTTSLPSHSIVAIKNAFGCLVNNRAIQERLYGRIEKFKSLLPQIILDSERYIESSSPIQVIKISGNAQVKKVSEILKSNKLDVRPILSPTVAEGEERLRICLHEYNTDVELELLVELLTKNT